MRKVSACIVPSSMLGGAQSWLRRICERLANRASTWRETSGTTWSTRAPSVESELATMSSAALATTPPLSIHICVMPAR